MANGKMANGRWQLSWDTQRCRANGTQAGVPIAGDALESFSFRKGLTALEECN